MWEWSSNTCVKSVLEVLVGWKHQFSPQRFVGITEGNVFHVNWSLGSFHHQDNFRQEDLIQSAAVFEQILRWERSDKEVSQAWLKCKCGSIFNSIYYEIQFLKVLNLPNLTISLLKQLSHFFEHVHRH